ncbi:MAG: membrane dipeptidase [Anaerolineaceae bacterium]|nr:membrane dipeptidase [Anaerolineaceae bacterium]
MLIWDAHLDLAMIAITCNRNLLEPVSKIRERDEIHKICPVHRGRGEGTVAFPEMRKGRIAVTFATSVANVAAEPRPYLEFETAYHAHAIARGHLAYYRALERDGYVRILTDLIGLEDHMAEWVTWDEGDNPDPQNTPPIGLIINMEGADPVIHPDELHDWWALGQRMIMLGHFGPGRYAGGTGTEQPLNDSGKDLLKEAENLGMIFDINHLSDQSFWQALDHFSGRIIASHSNARALVPGQRQLDDDQLKAIIERKGVIGVCPDLWMLVPDWVVGVSTNDNIQLGTLVDHIDHICQLAGNSLNASMGTDLDGGFGTSQCPNDLDTIADLQKIPAILTARGYTEEDVENIMYRNLYRLITETWSE